MFITHYFKSGVQVHNRGLGPEGGPCISVHTKEYLWKTEHVHELFAELQAAIGLLEQFEQERQNHIDETEERNDD